MEPRMAKKWSLDDGWEKTRRKLVFRDRELRLRDMESLSSLGTTMEPLPGGQKTGSVKSERS